MDKCGNGVGKGKKGLFENWRWKKGTGVLGMASNALATGYSPLHIAWPLFAESKERGDFLQHDWVFERKKRADIV